MAYGKPGRPTNAERAAHLAGLEQVAECPYCDGTLCTKPMRYRPVQQPKLRWDLRCERCGASPLEATGDSVLGLTELHCWTCGTLTWI